MKKIPFEVEKIIETLENGGFRAHIVGGCVRDMLLDIDPNDYDVTTNALPDDIKSLFEKTVDTGIKHGTVTVISGNTPVEVTTYRTDGEYTDMRHPETVSFVSDLKEDLARRDFTVNAMAYNKTEGIIDCFGGQEDIKNRLLRAVGDPEKRFSEDALRIMRLFRFSSTLGFAVEENARLAAKKLCRNLKNVSGERIWAELSKLLLGKDTNALYDVIVLGGLESFGITGDRDTGIISRLPEDINIRFFAFCKILDLDFLKVAEKLKIKNSIKNYCKRCENILFINEKPDDFEIKTALAVAGTQIVYDIITYKTVMENRDMSRVRKRVEQIIKAAEPYKISHLKITGDDLKKLGLKDKEIGEMLDLLCDDTKRHPEHNKREKLINIARKTKTN